MSGTEQLEVDCDAIKESQALIYSLGKAAERMVTDEPSWDATVETLKRHSRILGNVENKYPSFAEKFTEQGPGEVSLAEYNRSLRRLLQFTQGKGGLLSRMGNRRAKEISKELDAADKIIRGLVDAFIVYMESTLNHNTLETYQELYQSPASPIKEETGSYDRRSAGPGHQEGTRSPGRYPRALRRREQSPDSLPQSSNDITVIPEDSPDTSPVRSSQRRRSPSHVHDWTSSNPRRLGDTVNYSPGGRRVRFSSVYNENGQDVSSYHSGMNSPLGSSYAPLGVTYYPGYGGTSPALGPSYRPMASALASSEYNGITGMDHYPLYGRPQAYTGSIYSPGSSDLTRRLKATRGYQDMHGFNAFPEREVGVAPLAGASERPSSPLAPRGVPSPSSPPDLTGQVKKSRPRPIFDGTYSTVYEGVLGEEKVAIKMIRSVKRPDAMIRKIRRELETWWRLVHRNILPLRGFVEDDGEGIFSAMISPWAEKGNAAEYIEQDLTYTQRIELFKDVAKGLSYLHGFTPVIVHADLKPANILIDSDGRGMLCDFGLVRIVKDDVDTGMTTTTAHTGTARYLSQELVAPPRDEAAPLASGSLPTPDSDVHALGCIGMEIIYKRPPYAHINSGQSSAHYAICRSIAHGIPPARRSRSVQGTIGEMWAVFEECWSLDPEERPGAQEVCDYLELRGQAVAEALSLSEDPVDDLL